MKLIILAAGEGTRLKPYTNLVPKCLVHYKGKPIIEWTLDAAKQCGLEETVIVGGYQAQQLKGISDRLYINHNYSTTNMVHSLFSAEPELNDDVIVCYGDIVVREEVFQALINSQNPFSLIVDAHWRMLWEQRMEYPLRDAETLKINSKNEIVEIGKKTESYNDIQGQYIGLFKISGSIIDEVKNFYHSLDKNILYDSRPFYQIYMTSFIQLVIDRLMPVHPVIIRGGWIEIDTPRDLECEIM